MNTGKKELAGEGLSMLTGYAGTGSQSNFWHGSHLEGAPVKGQWIEDANGQIEWQTGK